MRTALLVVLACRVSAQDAVLEGTVLDALTHQPLEGVRVGILRRFDKVTRTDLHGRFRIEGAGPGRQPLTVTKTGYVDSGYGEQFAAENGATLRLTPTAQLQGTLVGEDDRPLAGCHVYAGSFSAETDAEGRFHLEHLRPGSHQLHFLLPTATVRQHLRVDAETNDRYGYPPSHEDALPVVLAAGANRQGHRVRLRRQLLVELSGTLTDEATRAPLRGGEVELALAGGNVYSDESLKRQAARNGRFRFDLLPPGQHTLYVYREGAGGLPYALAVDVGRRGVVEANLRVPVFPTVRARLVFEKDKRPEGLDVQLQLFGNRASLQGQPNAEGVVEFRQVPPGERYRLSATWSGRVNLPEGIDMRQALRDASRKALQAGRPKWYLKRIAVNGQSVREHEPFALVGPAEIEVLVSDARGVVIFEAVDEHGKPVPDAVIHVRGAMSQLVAAQTAMDFPEGELEAAAFPAGTHLEQTAHCAERRKVNVKSGGEQRVRLTLCR